MASTAYRPELDGLRAIAVLAVVLYHAGFGPQAGFVGVDVFFVISGYLITNILLRNDQIDFLEFYARRMRRIVPALMVVVTVTLAVSLRMFPSAHIAESAAASMLFAANIYFHETTGGYFDPDTAHLPLLHLWSLGVEEQFYLVWPAVLALVWRWRQKLLIPLVVTLALSSFLAAELLDRHLGFYSMPTRFWELAAGGLIAMAPPMRVRLAEAGLLLLGVALFVPLNRFPGIGALPAVAGTAAVILTLHGGTDTGVAGRLLRLRPMVFTGLISYSLYLWHWPLLVFETLLNVGPPSKSHRLALVVVAGFLAWLTYRFVETHFRRNTTATPAGKVVFTAVALSAGVATAALSLNNQHPSQVTDTRCHYSVETGQPPGLPPDTCNSIPSQTPEILIWGDSHAMAWKPFAWRLGERYGLSVAAFTYAACPPALQYGFGQPACSDFNNLALEYVKSHRLDTVILSTRLLSNLHRLPATYSNQEDDQSLVEFHRRETLTASIYNGRYQNLKPVAFEQRKALLTSGLTRTVDAIAPLVRRVILMGPLPQARKPVPLCRALGQEAECSMSRSEFNEYARASYELLDNLASRHPNVSVLKVEDFFCDSRSCPIVIGGQPVFADTDHLTRKMAEAFFDSFVAMNTSPD